MGDFVNEIRIFSNSVSALARRLEGKPVRKPYLDECYSIETSYINDIKQNGPATILLTIGGGKFVVKLQEGDEYYNLYIGFHICLVKYLLDDSKLYHDVVQYVFDSDESATYRNYMLQAIIISRIGLDDYCRLANKFFDEEEE